MPKTYGKKMASRFGYGEALSELGAMNNRIVAVGADVTGSTGVNMFADKFPDRYIQVGIAEQNALTVSCGLAVSGMIPFVCAYSIFITGRAWEQIRNSVCHPDLNVKIAGSHSGVTVGPDGATHQALEEIAIMRVIPRMTVVIPCDYEEAKKATRAIAAVHGPAFIRLGRVPMPVITTHESPFVLGQAAVLNPGNDAAIVACGSLVYEALVAAEQLSAEGIRARVINVHTIKPLDEKTIAQAAKECGALVTAEEHQIAGGLGGAVAEALSRTCPVPMEYVGINDVFGESGEPEELLNYFNLNAAGIIAAVKKVLLRKKGA